MGHGNVNKSTMVPPKKRRSLANGNSSSPKQSNDDSATLNEDETMATRNTRRKSVIAEEINISDVPSTPTRRSRRLSESLAGESNKNEAGCATPTRRSRRLSGALTDDCTTVDVGTPTRRSRRLSETGLQSTTESTLTGDLLRRTRRASEAGIDNPLDSPVPLGDTLRRTRRTSGTFADINPDSPNAVSLKRADLTDVDSKITTANKTPAKRGRRKSLVLEEVAEEKVSDILDVIKEDEEKENDDISHD